MKFFAGLDLGLNETAVCIIDGEGEIVSEAKVVSEPEALVAYLEGSGCTFGRIGLEACPLSQWIHDGLSAAGLPVVCLEVRRLKASLAGAINKTDKNDARGIAQVVRLGWFRSVHVKSDASHRIRTLLSARKMLQKQVQDLENHIRGSLKIFGLKVGSVTKRTFEVRVVELIGDDLGIRSALAPLLRVRSQLLAEFRALDKQTKDAARLDPVCLRFMTVPGVGPITSLTFRSAVDAPGRFRSSKAVGAHFGLTPRKYQSGETDWSGRISKCGDVMARAALYEAANALLIRGSRWSALRSWGMRVAKRRGLKEAKVAVARKLAVILHRMWVDSTEFRWGGNEVAAA